LVPYSIGIGIGHFTECMHGHARRINKLDINDQTKYKNSLNGVKVTNCLPYSFK